MKKHLIKSLAFGILGLGATNLSAQYCTAVGASSTADSNVDSIGLTGDAGSAISYLKVCTATGLEDLTATQSASVTAGNNYNTTVVFGTCGTTPYAGAGEVWIDWNQNDVFDAAESIGTWTGSPTDTSTFAFTVPASAFNGTTRMRVMQQEGGTVIPPLNPCGTFSWGSVADFSIVVSGGVTITCALPSTLTATNILATSADLGWTENGTATSWAVEYGAQGFAQGTGMMMVTGANPLNVTGLMPNSSYGFYVRAICAPGDSSAWAGPFTFVTPCAAVVTPTYSEDFSTYLSPCWYEAQGVLSTSTVLTGTASNWTGASFGNTGSNNSARINLYGTGRDEWVLSQSIDLGTTATNYQLEFDIALTDYFNTSATTLGVDDTIAVVISTDNGATWQLANVLQLWVAGSEPSNTGDHIVIDLSAYTGIVQFGFYAASSVSNADNDVFIDNFLVTNLATCAAPTALTTSNVLATSADLAWTEAGTATSWAVYYGPAGSGPGAAPMMVTGSNPLSLTGLMSATSYEFYVRAICGPGDTSAFAGPFMFVTPCSVVSGDVSSDAIAVGTLPYTTTGNTDSCYMNTAGNASADVWYQYIIEPCTDSLTISLCGSAFDTYLRVFASDASTQLFFNDDNFTACGSSRSHLAIDVTNDASANVGDTIYIMVEGYTTNQGIYDLNITSTIQCPATNLVITEIMYNPAESGTDTTEFVEIYNNGATAADLTNYTLSGIAYTFPSVSLAAGGYYVIGVNASAFNTVYGFAADGIATGGLSNGGEAIIIRDATGVVVDSVRYDDNTPWPSGSGAGLPDGGGSSIILCDTASDNADGNNWNACVTSTGVTVNGFAVLASPGMANACPAPLDVAIASFYNLDSTYCNVATITGSVIITNMSATDATNVPYTITANGTPIGNGTIALLAGNASDTITVGPLPAATGVANIVAMTSLTGDINASNDMLSMMVYISNTSATASVMTAIACNGDSTGAVMAVGTDGLGTYTYMWNANANLASATLMNVPAGMHSVVVMDSIGCTDTAMVTLTEPTAIVLTDSVDNVLCKGDSTGMAMVMATGGTPVYSYAWSNGGTADMIMNLGAGSYTVTVSDMNGCMGMMTSTVMEPTVGLSLTITDNGDGTAYATATGGTAGYTFLWDAAAGSQTTDTITGLVHNGTYMVTATDANGCTAMASVTVTIVGVNNIANLSNLNLFPNPTNANVFVELELVENADVQINITNSIGQLVISKELTNVQSEKVELNTSTLASGVYMVQFTIGTELVTRKLIVSKQ